MSTYVHVRMCHSQDLFEAVWLLHQLLSSDVDTPVQADMQLAVTQVTTFHFTPSPAIQGSALMSGRSAQEEAGSTRGPRDLLLTHKSPQTLQGQTFDVVADEKKKKES